MSLDGSDLLNLLLLLDDVKNVEIDEEGKFKYILVDVWKEGAEDSVKTVVRGTKAAEFHPDIFAKVEPDIKAAGLECRVAGGGKIIHDPDSKVMKVFSKSTGFGRADHAKTVSIIKKEFEDYNITWSDDD